MAQELDEAKYQVAVANRVLAELGLATGVLASLGHVSMRLPTQPDRFVIKGRGYSVDALAVMQPGDMLVCDLNGYMVDGPPASSQVQEVMIHSCIFKTHPEVQSVVHVHPRFTVVMSVLQANLVPMCNEGNLLVRNLLPVFQHCRLILTEEDGMEVASLLGPSKAIILRGHGAATVGGTLAEAVMTMAQLEEQARMNWYAYCAAGPDHPRIPGREIDEWAENYLTIPELPHLKEPLAQPGVQQPGSPISQAGGAWAYYSQLVERQM